MVLVLNSVRRVAAGWYRAGREFEVPGLHISELREGPLNRQAIVGDNTTYGILSPSAGETNRLIDGRPLPLQRSQSVGPAEQCFHDGPGLHRQCPEKARTPGQVQTAERMKDDSWTYPC